LTHGRHQLSLGAWLQQFQSNETIRSVSSGKPPRQPADFLQELSARFCSIRRPRNELACLVLAQFYVEDVIRRSPKLTISLGFRGDLPTAGTSRTAAPQDYTFSTA